MAVPFKTYATIGGKRYRIFKPKEFPETVFAYDIKDKTTHRIDEPVLKLLNIDKTTFRPYQLPNILKGMPAGQVWNESWYKQQIKDTGPPKVSVEPKKIPDKDKIKTLTQQVSFGQRSEEVRLLQDLLKSAGYFPTPQLSTGYYGPVTKQAVESFNKSLIKIPDFKTFDTQRGYALVREKDTLEVYTLDPKTGQVRWLTAEAVRPAGFDLTKVTEVPRGYVGQFKTAGKWTKSNTYILKPTVIKQVEKVSDPQQSIKDLEPELVTKYKEVKHWGFETRSKAASVLSGYANFLTSPVSFTTAKTTPALKLKPVEETKAEVIAKDLVDYSKLTPEYKEQLNKKYQFDPDYGWEEIKRAHLGMEQSQSEEMISAGFKNADTGKEDFPLALDVDSALKEIELATSKMSELEKGFVETVKKLEDVGKKGESFDGQFEDLYKNIDRLDTEIVFESSSDSPDKEKLADLKIQRDKEVDKVNALNLKVKPILHERTALLKKLKEIEAASQNERAKFDKENMSVKWANLFALIEYKRKEEVKIKEWLILEKQGIIHVYETGQINLRDAVERLNANISDPKDYWTIESFKNSLSAETLRRRKQALKHQFTKTVIEVGKAQKDFNTGIETLKVMGTAGWKAVEKANDIYSAGWTLPFQLLEDIKEYTGMSAELNALVKALPSTKEVKDMNKNQRTLYMDSLVYLTGTADRILADAPKFETATDKTKYLAKSFADKIWNADWSEVSLYRAMEGDSWIPKQYQTQAKIVLGAALMGAFIKNANRNKGLYIDLFKKVNNKIIPKLGGPAKLSVSKFVGQALKNQLGEPFTKLIKSRYGLPNVSDVLERSFAKHWPKHVPSGEKQKIQSELFLLDKRKSKIDANLTRMIDKYAPDKAGIKRLQDIAAGKITPDDIFMGVKKGKTLSVSAKTKNQMYFEFLGEIDPGFYGEINKLVKVGYQLEDIPVVIKSLKKSLQAEATFTSMARTMGGKVEKWMQPKIIELRIYSEKPAMRKQYLKYLNKEFSPSVVKKIKKSEAELKIFSDAVRNIHGKMGKPVNIPWIKIKGVENVNWLVSKKKWAMLNQPKNSAGLSFIVQGSPKLAKFMGMKSLSNPNKTFSINIINKNVARTMDDVSAMSFNKGAEALSEVNAHQFFNGMTLDEFLITNLEKRIAKNPELKKIYNLIAEIFTGKTGVVCPADKKIVMRKMYAIMIEAQQAVDLNLKIGLRSWGRLSSRSENTLAQVKTSLANLAKKEKLLSPDEIAIFYPKKLTKQQAQTIIKKYGSKKGKQMIDILEGGIQVNMKEIPYFEPYRRGYVKVKNPKLKRQIDKNINNDIPKLIPGYELPRLVKDLDPYDLVPGMMRSITERTNLMKAEDFKAILSDIGIDSRQALIKYTKAAIKDGKFPRLDPVVMEFLGKPKQFVRALSRGKINEAEKIAKRRILKIINKGKSKSFYTDKQRKAINDWGQEFEELTSIKTGSVKEVRKACGLYTNITGAESSKLWDLELIGDKRLIAAPLWLKQLGTGSWKQTHPHQANVFRGILSLLNTPQTLWKYSVLFLRPGWGVRNMMDDSLKMGILAEGGMTAKSYKNISLASTPLGWKYIRKELQARTVIGRKFEHGTMFLAENPTFNNQTMKALSFYLVDRTGVFGKLANRAFQKILKIKRGMENLYAQTEVLRKEALFLNATFKYADDAVKSLWDDILKMQGDQKDILLKLRGLVPGKKNFNKITRITEDLVRGKLKKTDQKWVLAMGKKYKMKDGAILEKGFKEVDRVLFDYSDLSEVGKALRWIYPFWGFWSKNFILWSQSVAKNPGQLRAAIFYLKAIEEAGSDLPDWYKKRIKVWGHWYTLSIYSYQQVLDVWKDPFGEFGRWLDNANHPISGLGWNPSISIGIKKFTGKGYFDEEKDLKSLGYTNEMLRRMGVENYNLEKNNNVWAIYARQIPIFQLVSTFQTVSNEMLETMDSAVGSKKMNAAMSYFFGIPLIKIDDLNKLWGVYNRLPYKEKTKFVNNLPEGQYQNFYKLLAAKNLQKILDATSHGITDKIYFQYMYDWEYRNKYYSILEGKGKKQANYFLANNKLAREAMERHWDLAEYSPQNAATEYIFNKSLVRGAAFDILKQLDNEIKKGMETHPAEWFAITGEGYEVAYTKEDLQNDIFREDGTIIPETFEELKAMMPKLNSLPWLKKMVEESISKSEEFPEEYYRLVVETDKEQDDYEYYIAMNTFGKTVYIDSETPASPKARGAAQRAGYELWDSFSSEIKAMHLERYPAKNVWHEFKSSYVKKLGFMTAQENIENWFQNFYNNEIFTAKDREVYFIKHPDRAIYYPAALENAKLMAQDDINKQKGEFSSLGWDYLNTLSPEVQAAWERDKPQFWETYRWHRGYQALIKAANYEKAMDFYWSPKYQGARDRYFLKNPDQEQFRKDQKDYWSMPQNTYEDRQKALDWWFKHPDYIKWTHRYDVTEEQKTESALRDKLKEINYQIKPEGSGEAFYMDQAKLEAEKRMIYEENPQLQEEFEKGLKGEAKRKYELTQEFFAIDPYDFEAKQKFLELHPELKEAWTAMTPPWERKILDLQAQYFILKTSDAKEKFLKEHPELPQYWEAKALPWSYWFDKPKFKQDQATVVSIVEAIEKNQTLTPKETAILKNPKNEDEKYIANKVYQWSMGKWIEHGRTDSTKGWEFFQGLPPIIRETYFLRNPKMKQYFEFTSEWHRRLQISSEEGASFFNTNINKEWREMYYDRHPEAKKFFEQLGEVSVMPNKTWEDAQKVRRWWEQHQELSIWLRRRETKDEEIFRKIKETYFAIIDRTPITGSGMDFWTKYFRVQKEADDFMAEHPELREWFKDHRAGDEAILKLQEEYFKIDNPELRNEFLKKNPELKDSWFDKSSPKKREVLKLQEGYFAIPKNSYAERSKYLLDNPELLVYWNAQSLPSEAYFEPKAFKAMNHNLDLLQKYFDSLVVSTQEGEIAFGKLDPKVQNNFLDGSLNEYEKTKAYLMAMNTWMKVIDENFLRGNFYFKSLPTWIRKRYFKAHPEKQFTFSIPLEDFITEPLKEWEKENPTLAWAYRTVYDYGTIKEVPDTLAKKVEEIFIKEGIWQDRKAWGKAEWRDYWKELAMLKHDIRDADVERLPQLREAIERAAKQYPMKPKPRPLFRTKPRKGFMKPFI